MSKGTDPTNQMVNGGRIGPAPIPGNRTDLTIHLSYPTKWFGGGQSGIVSGFLHRFGERRVEGVTIQEGRIEDVSEE